MLTRFLLLARLDRLVARLEFLFGLAHKSGDERLLLVDQPLHRGLEFGEPVVVGLGDRAADDQRRARFVDQDRVDFVDDGEVVATLDQAFGVVDERVVAQVIETELVVGAVGDVGAVALAALGTVRLVAVDHVDGQAVEAEDRGHPLGVALGEVRVDRDDVDAASGERVEVHRRHADERLALARLHLGDLALVHRYAAQELHVVGNHVPLDQGAARFPLLADHPAARLFDDGECFG